MLTAEICACTSHIPRSSCKSLRNPYSWKELLDRLYKKEWCPYIKETFNGFGNAIEYLGRYTHKIAISNSRILDITETDVTFSARGKKTGDPKRRITLSHTEFIRRYLMHVLPSGFQKIRYYGFLNNRKKRKNLRVIFQLQNGQRFKQRYQGMTMAELLKAVWNFDICLCPAVKGTLISLFLLPEKDAIPIQSRQNFRELVQLERITFRAAFCF